jgi:beta-glucosidase/6-phospho-beta-glucosidase/beta-galactosidase
MHYVMPLWVSEKGGVTWSEYPKYFGEYCKHVVQKLALAPASVTYFMTLNEPNIQVRFGYLDAQKFPPGINDATEAVKALAGLAKGHIEGYRQIHSLGIKSVQVGFAHNWQIFVPLDEKNEADIKMAGEVDWMFNRAFMEAITTGTLHFAMPGAKTIQEKVSLPSGKAALD